MERLLWSSGFCLISFQVGVEEDCCQRVVSQLSGALSHLHSLGFVHRDLKPENVFLCDAACRWVKLGDYGMVGVERRQRVCSSHKLWCLFFLGGGEQITVAPPHQVKARGARVPEVWYSSPYCTPEAEVARGNEDGEAQSKSRVWASVEPSTDSWALGILTYAMLSGAHPWAHTSADCLAYRKYVEWFQSSKGPDEEAKPQEERREDVLDLIEAGHEKGGRAPVAPQFACFTPLAHAFFRSLLDPRPRRRGRPEDGLSYLGGGWLTEAERARLEERRKKSRGK